MGKTFPLICVVFLFLHWYNGGPHHGSCGPSASYNVAEDSLDFRNLFAHVSCIQLIDCSSLDLVVSRFVLVFAVEHPNLINI